MGHSSDVYCTWMWRFTQWRILRPRRQVELGLIEDAKKQGWQREKESELTARKRCDIFASVKKCVGFTMRSRISWRIFLHSPSGDVYFSGEWTILKLWEEHRIFYEDLPGGWYLRAVSQPLRRAVAQGTGWARGRRNAGPFTQPAEALDDAWHHPRGLRVRSRDRVLP